MENQIAQQETQLKSFKPYQLYYFSNDRKVELLKLSVEQLTRTKTRVEGWITKNNETLNNTVDEAERAKLFNKNKIIENEIDKINWAIYIKTKEEIKETKQSNVEILTSLYQTDYQTCAEFISAMLANMDLNDFTLVTKEAIEKLNLKLTVKKIK
jgi:hypothetical protein